MKQENKTLEDIFNKLVSLLASNCRSPFTQSDAQLFVEKINSLDYNGAVIHEGCTYYLAEIYR